MLLTVNALGEDQQLYYATDQASFDDYVTLLANNPGEFLAGDTETCVKPEYKALGIGTALRSHYSLLSVLVLQAKGSLPVVFDNIIGRRNEVDFNRLINLMQSRKVIFHNAKFDIQIIHADLGVWLDNVHCTLQLAKLHSNATGSKFGQARGLSLKALLRDFLSVQLTGKGKEQISDWYSRPIDLINNQDWINKLAYAANDVRYLHRIHAVLWHVLTLPMPRTSLNPNGATKGPFGLDMGVIAEREMQLVRVMAEMETNGFPACELIYKRTQAALLDERLNEGLLVELSAEICKRLGLETQVSLWTDYEIPTQASLKALNNPVKLKALLANATGIHLPAAQSAIFLRLIALLDMLGNDGSIDYANDDEADMYAELELLDESVVSQANELLNLIVKYKKLQKLYSMDLGSHISPVTGAIHSNYDSNGAATGRLASRNVNGQNISGRTQVEIEIPLNILC